MKVCIFPVIENPEHFSMFCDKIKNVHKLDCCLDEEIQCSSDGVWCCDKKSGQCLRTKNKIKINVFTMQEAKPNEKGSHIQEMLDFVEHKNKIEYKIHKDSGISIKDIEEQRLKNHQDYGNGITSPFVINGKPCTLVILNEGLDIDPNVFDLICEECHK
jgi:hypothetical protein